MSARRARYHHDLFAADQGSIYNRRNGTSSGLNDGTLCPLANCVQRLFYG